MTRDYIDNINVTIKNYTMTYTPKFYWDDSTIEYLIECYDNDGEHHMILRLKEHVDTCHLEDDETYEELEDDLLEQVMQAIG